MRRNKYVILAVFGCVSFGVVRSIFAIVDDPEGPNLFVVTALAVVVFAVMYAVYRLVNHKK